jgi:lysophospholipase L1-like esterase
MYYRWIFLPLFLICAAGSCQEAQQDLPGGPGTPVLGDTALFEAHPSGYLALGDSYTIGERVSESERWPVQLGDSLAKGGDTLQTTIIARTGWTTSELIAGIVQANLSDTFEIVSLLIGVNNQYRRQPLAQYETEFEELLQTAIGFAGGRSDKVFVLSIPDYGVTPFAANRDPERIGREIDAFNAAHQAICGREGVRWFDITGISREAKEDPGLIAPDGLHPSGEMYRRWVQLILPEIREMLRIP